MKSEENKLSDESEIFEGIQMNELAMVRVQDVFGRDRLYERMRRRFLWRIEPEWKTIGHTELIFPYLSDQHWLFGIPMSSHMKSSGIGNFCTEYEVGRSSEERKSSLVLVIPSNLSEMVQR